MRKCFLIAAVAAIMALPAATAQAGVLSSLLSFDGTTDVIEDDSVGSFIERGTVDGILEVGDLLQGMITFSPIDTNNVPTGSSVIGFYSLEIKSIGVGGSSLELGAASGADDAVAIAAGAGVDVSGLSGSHAGMDNGFVVMESSTVDVGANDFAGPSFGFVPPVLASDFKAVTVLGFDGIDDHHTVNAVIATDLTDLSTAAGLATTGIGPLGIFNGTYSVTDHGFGASTVFLPLLNVLSGASGDVTIVNGSINATDLNTDANGWDYSDDGNFNINAVPEPGTMAIFACIGLVGLARRRSA